MSTSDIAGNCDGRGSRQTHHAPHHGQAAGGPALGLLNGGDHLPHALRPRKNGGTLLWTKGVETHRRSLREHLSEVVNLTGFGVGFRVGFHPSGHGFGMLGIQFAQHMRREVRVVAIV